MPVDIVIQKILTFSDEDINDIFVTALEGGIGYWSQAHHYDPDNTFALIVDIVSDDEDEYTIDASCIVLGLRRILSGQVQVRSDILEMFNPADMDVDSDGADCVVQAGLFGEIRYG